MDATSEHPIAKAIAVAGKRVEPLQAQGKTVGFVLVDGKATAKWVADQVGLDEYFAEVLPQDKAAKVKEIQSRGVLVP